MYNHLRLTNHKGLKSCILQDLGQINVICGRNNSGKSTLMEAIHSDDHREIGRKFSADDISSTLSEWLRQLAWAQQGPEAQILRNVLEAVVQQQSCWFEEDAPKFVQSVGNLFEQQAKTTGARIRQQGRASFIPYQQLFATVKRELSVFLPPKRSLEMSQDVNTNQDILPNGTGLLNRLFWAKNQPTTSIDRATLDKLRDAFQAITGGYQFEVFTSAAKNLITLHFAFQKGAWRPAVDCGLGLQDALTILYFAIDPGYPVVLVEEPEAHLHPEMQRKLLQFLKDTKGKQFFLSTHSNVFLDNSLVDRIFFTTCTETVKVDDATGKAMILNDLGYSVADNLVSDLVILVEGPSDVGVIEEFLLKTGTAKTYDVRAWPLGGDIMDQLDLSFLAASYRLIALIDRDPGSDKVRNRFIKNCQENNIPVHRLEWYSIENYFSVRALRECFGSQIPPELTALDSDKSVEDQLGMSVKRNNRKLAKLTTLVEIDGTDLRTFFGYVDSLCRSAAS